MFLATVTSASGVSQEKDRRTLILLLLTRMSSSQIVLGKLVSSLIGVANLILAALPLLLLIAILGGVSATQVYSATAIVFVTACWSAALANVVAFWREKTFQSIAMTVLLLLMLLVIGEVAGALLPMGESARLALSPVRALWAAASPLVSAQSTSWLDGSLFGVVLYTVFAIIASVAVLGYGVARVRVWNPSREVRMKAPEIETSQDMEAEKDPASWKVRAPRPVWDNPILWREIRTWAYGRKVVVIRMASISLFVLVAAVVYWQVSTGEAMERAGQIGRSLPAATLPVLTCQ